MIMDITSVFAIALVLIAVGLTLKIMFKNKSKTIRS